MSKNIDRNIQKINLDQHEGDKFLIGGYRVKKGQHNWIFGIKPQRDTCLYNTRFTVTGVACRNGAMNTGELPDFVILYDFIDKQNVRLFKCLSYSIKTSQEMKDMKYPIQCNKTHSYILYELGDEYDASYIDISKLITYAQQKYPDYKVKTECTPFTITGCDIVRAMAGELPLLEGYENIRIVDLFAGLGGFHHAFRKVGKEMGFNVDCVYISELKEDLRKLYARNYEKIYDEINPDITQLNSEDQILENVPEHDILCAGFPCQPFSQAGKQQGFNDDEGRGELFYYIANIIKIRRPRFIFLENVSNLETHDDGNTWKTIYNILNNSLADGGLDYNIKYEVLSPHEYGLPQHRKRIYIVGQAREYGEFDFHFPTKPKEATCDINTIINRKAINIQPISQQFTRYIEVWQQFIDLCIEHRAELPHAPVWAMEFGANYPYEKKAPCFSTKNDLDGYHGRLGEIITGESLAECLQHLPNYSKKSKTEVFPNWKIKFIRENREFYKRNKEWIDIWKEQLIGWEDSFIKFEYNCPENDKMNLYDKILQFRPSGLRVKLPNYSPALTFMSSQVPIYPWVSYSLPNGQKGIGRYMTIQEGANLQGMGELSFEGLSDSRVYGALGNAVDVGLVKLIAKNLITTYIE